jgi:hypothetical protein
VREAECRSQGVVSMEKGGVGSDAGVVTMAQKKLVL